MASRRRPPASRPSEPPAEQEAPQDAAERTVISQMPVFEDEMPTPVPRVQTPPRRGPPPRGEVTRSRPRQPAKLGAAVPVATADPTAAGAPAIRREATFIGLPVGLGAPPKAAVSPELKKSTSAPAPKAPVSLPLPPARGPATPPLSLGRPAAAPQARSTGLRLSKPGGARAPVPAPPVGAAPGLAGPLSQPAGLPLSAGNAGLPRTAPPTDDRSGSSRMIWAAAVVVVLIIGTFVYAARDTEPELAPGVTTVIARTTVARTAGTNNVGRTMVGRQPAPSSAVQRAQRAKRSSASIARRRGGAPVWGKARLVALSKPGAEVPEFGGIVRKDIDYHRSYLKEDLGPDVPMLMIFTQPPGMTIEVAGQLYGRTPMLRPLYTPVPSLDIRLTGAGFTAQRQTVRAGKDGSIRLNVVMTSLP